MTLLEILQVGIRRAGLDEAYTDHQTDALTYFNEAIIEIESDATWWWKFKVGNLTTTKTMTLTSQAGTYTAGETVTGSATGATATVGADNGDGTITVYSESATAFTTSDTVTGDSSAATGTYASIATTQLYTLASDVMNLLAVFNKTDDHPMTIESPVMMQQQDPDFSEEGTVRQLYVYGLDSATGDVTVGLFPRPSATNKTIQYQYYGMTPELNSLSFSTDVGIYIPRTIQPAVYYKIAELLTEENSDGEKAALEAKNYDKIMQRARRQNLDMMGNMKYRRERSDKIPVAFKFKPPEGSL